MTDQNLVELLTLTNDLLVTANNRLALMEQHLAVLRGQAAQPAAPAPLPAPAGPFAPIAGWVCPEHGTSRTVPAGVSKKTGKPYHAFMVCGEQGCEARPDRAPLPQRAIPPSAGGQMP